MAVKSPGCLAPSLLPAPGLPLITGLPVATEPQERGSPWSRSVIIALHGLRLTLGLRLAGTVDSSAMRPDRHRAARAPEPPLALGGGAAPPAFCCAMIKSYVVIFFVTRTTWKKSSTPSIMIAPASSSR